MNEHTAEIKVNANGTGKLVIDGMDVSNVIQGFDLSGHVGEIPRLALDLPLTRGAIAMGHVAVSLDAEVCAVLEHLGWTPPDSPAVEQRSG